MLSFKKTIACLMSLIMIMTVTPFTAVTASAHGKERKLKH